jgi:hypothetical protein
MPIFRKAPLLRAARCTRLIWSTDRRRDPVASLPVSSNYTLAVSFGGEVCDVVGASGIH